MKLKDRHWMCCTCHHKKPKGWKGLCPHCNPQQIEAYECPESRWTKTPWGTVLTTGEAFLAAIVWWLKSVVSGGPTGS